MTMNILKRTITAITVGICFHTPAFAQGIPVFDAASLVQAIEQVKSWTAQYNQMKQNIDAITGSRNLGNILNNPLLQNVIPKDVVDVFNAINTNGSSGLTGKAQALRAASKIFDCQGQTGQAFQACQALLNSNSQVRSYLQEALDIVNQRVTNVQNLQDQINKATDAKSIADLQARLQTESAQIGNDQNRIKLLTSMAEAQAQQAAQAQRELNLKMLSPETPSAASTFVYQKRQ